MYQLEEKTLSEMVDAVVRAVDPERIILFGSRARGDFRDDSDIDLMIVEREPFGPERNRFTELSRVRAALSPFILPKDILVFSLDEILKWALSPNHIIYKGLNEGKALYEKEGANSTNSFFAESAFMQTRLPSLSDPEHARMMVAIAERDRRAMAGMLDQAVFEEDVFGFLAQQAVEKAAKAWLSWIGVTYPRTHDIKTLFGLIASHGATVPPEFLPLIDLTEYGVLTRYTLSESQATPFDRPQVIQQVTKFLIYVESLIPAE